MLDSVLYSDEPKKVSLPSLIDDDVLDDLYDEADRISSQVKFLPFLDSSFPGIPSVQVIMLIVF